MATTDAAATRARYSRSVRVVRIGGNALLVIGAIALIWAVVIWRWGDPATGLYTRWEQRRLEKQLAVVQEGFQPKPLPASATPSPATPVDRQEVARQAARRLSASAGAGDPVGRIRVERLGLDMIVVEGTDHDSLKLGPGIDRRTALPGQGQLVYIAGHRTTYGAPFAHIDRMRRGDLIKLEMPYGNYVYRVTSWVITPATDLSRLRSRGREEIALQACHPRFSARERYIVYARPVSGPGITAVS